MFQRLIFGVVESISDNLILDTCEEQPCGNHGQCTGPNQCSCDDGYENTGHGCAGNFLKHKPKFLIEKYFYNFVFVKKFNFTLATGICDGDKSCGDHSHCGESNRCVCDNGFEEMDRKCHRKLFLT